MTVPARTRTPRYPKPKRLADAPELDQRVGQDGDPQRILFSGDTHGDADHVEWLILRASMVKADVVFVLGDFGIWDHLDGGRFTNAVSREAEKAGIPVLFLPGNHENYDLLFAWESSKPRLADGFYLIKPGLLYSPRGHRWTWHGTRFMSLGGAYSVDKQPRVLQDHMALLKAQRRQEEGRSLTHRDRYLLRTGQLQWWAQEEISQEELRHALRPGEVDVLLTHDKPRKATPGWDRKDLEQCWPNQEAIQEVVDEKKPKLLLHGHLHYPYDQRLPNGTVVKGLDCDPEVSRRSGGSGEKYASIALMELDQTWRSGDDGFTLTWSGRSFTGYSDNIHRDFVLTSADEKKALEK